MPRPELFQKKKVLNFTEEMLDQIDRWRARQKPIPTLSEAIRMLIEIGLRAGEWEKDK